MLPSEAIRVLLTHPDHKVREAAMVLQREILDVPEWAKREEWLPPCLKRQAD